MILQLRIYLITSIIVLTCGCRLSAQKTTSLEELESKRQLIEAKLIAVKEKIKVENIAQDKIELLKLGLPSEDYIEYLPFYLSYSEKHEQAKWTAHILNPLVSELGTKRTNDFRVDPKIETSTADSIDYFSFNTQTKKYTSYGYDRGHLIPSADFRWFQDAMSETYFYSNISPQTPELNRGHWAKFENQLRKHVVKEKNKLAIVTLPIYIKRSPLTIAESVNEVAIPDAFAKVVLELNTGKTIAFYAPNNQNKYSLKDCLVSVDSIESLTGFDFFHKVLDIDEIQVDYKYWLGNVLSHHDPVKQNTLPRGYYNTVSGGQQINNSEEVCVCGNVVGTRYSRSGNAWLNIDKKYPENYFTVMVKKADLVNFENDVVKYFLNKELCFKGKVDSFSGKPTMIVKSELKVLSIP